MTQGSATKCTTCYGEGTIGGFYGPQACVDCAGLGTLPSGTVLTERRLRELERIHTANGTELGKDVNWLVTEVRRAHYALLKILAASQEAEPTDEDAARIRHLANEVLGVYVTDEVNP